MTHFDDAGFARRYATARSMSPHAMRPWIDAIRATIDPGDIVSGVLDVGCGTGRFARPLADAFDANVVSIDPSLEMLREAGRLTDDSRVQWVGARADRVPVRDEHFGLAFMSMVYHHLEDPDAAFAELRRVLRVGGYLCIRNSTADCLDRVDYLRFFPRALAWSRARLPTRAGVLGTAVRSGLLPVAHEVIGHVFAESKSEYLEKIGLRTQSDLVAVPDEEFDTGLDAMKKAFAASADDARVVEPIDLFVFRRAA